MTAREMCALTDAEKNIFEYDWQDFWKYHYRHNDDVMNILRDSRDVINLVPLAGFMHARMNLGGHPYFPIISTYPANA
jgi:hypothetical protein